MPYKHGAFGEIKPSQEILPPSGVGTLPVFVGTAPIQQLADPTGAMDEPIMVNSFDEAKAALGYDDDWATFTLCEVMHAFFKNKVANIGPVVLINVMDPAIHTAVDSASVTLTDSVGYIDKPVVLESIAIDGAAEGVDYTAEYEDGRVKLTALTELVVSPVTVNFDKMDVSAVLATDIVGGVQGDGSRTGLANADLVYQNFGMIPTILAAPGWSDDADVYTGLISKAQKINGHWDALVVADMSTSATSDTITEAVTWKADNGFTSKLSKVFWPKVIDGDKLYHLSTLAAWRMQLTDFEYDNVPYVSPSNQELPMTGTVLASDNKTAFDELQANTLNAAGITTAVFSGGKWRLWGPHCANYAYGADIKPEDKFDASIRMLRYMTNTFQKNYMASVDGPMDRRKIESILDSAQLWINALKAEGKLLYGEIVFESTSNPQAELVEGDFVFDIKTTTTPVGKSLTFKVQYTSAGITTLFGGEA